MSKRRAWAMVLCLVAGLVSVAHSESTSSEPASSPRVARIVSLNPSLTAIVLELGAGDRLVGVDDYSARQRPEVARLPRVGGLFNPSLEAVVGLRPDLVVLVPSIEQRDFRERLESLEMRVIAFQNVGFEDVLDNVTQLGQLVDAEARANARVEAIRAARERVERAAASLPSPRTVVILQRDPVFIVGRGSFIDEMLAVAGAENLGATFPGAYPRVSVEWLVAAAPEVLIDMSPDTEAPEAYWARWPSLPAHANGRVLHLDPAQVTLPGPRLDRSLELLARALHGEAFARAVERDAQDAQEMQDADDADDADEAKDAPP